MNSVGTLSASRIIPPPALVSLALNNETVRAQQEAEGEESNLPQETAIVRPQL